MENQQLASPSQPHSSTPVGFGQGFLSKEQCDKTGASPILSWPGCSSFLPYSSTEISSEGTVYVCDANDIIQNAMEELKSLSQNGFQECFQQHFYSRWQKSLVAQRDYFEGNVA
jgi:hypothetical protein